MGRVLNVAMEWHVSADCVRLLQTTGSPGGVVEVDSTQVRLRKHRNDQTSSPVTTLKHEVARVAQRWSEAHPDEFDDSGPSPLSPLFTS